MTDLDLPALQKLRNKKLPPTPLSLDIASSSTKGAFSQITIINTNDPAPASDILQVKSLKRKNVKQLSLAPSEPESPGPGSTITTPITSDNYKINPESTNSTDKLISDFSNLELGLEFQLNLKNADLMTLKNLGSGNSGTVLKVLHLPTKTTMAKKIIHIETKASVQTQILRELRIMHECHSPHIIEFYGAFLNSNNVVICMEYLNCGSLDKILKLSGPFPDYVLKKLTFNVLKGLCYLYDNHKIIHRDVKPSNVLMNHKGQFKLCDFGVSRELANSLADTFVGTSTYMSPERIQGNVYSIKSDVWSLGLMLVELATGQFPFGDNSTPEGILDLLQRIVNEQPPRLDSSQYDPGLCTLVDCCLQKEDERLIPWDLLNHECLKDVEIHEKNVKVWAKKIRKLQKEKNEK